MSDLSFIRWAQAYQSHFIKPGEASIRGCYLELWKLEKEDDADSADKGLDGA